MHDGYNNLYHNPMGSESQIENLAVKRGVWTAEQEAWLRLPNHFMLRPGSSDYPPLLQEIVGAPTLLYGLGNPDLLRSPQVAIVGSRKPTALGREIAAEIAAALAAAGVTITSGLAVGIDAAAHQSALQYPASTIAVLGNGLPAIYPSRHRRLADDIVQHQGVLLSEFPLNSPPLRGNFPKRNRIISGLSLGTIVIEAGLRSGSLITARYAAEQNREVFAVPGSIRNPLAWGCHQLIEQGAQLIHEAQDVLQVLAPALAHALHMPLASSKKIQSAARSQRKLDGDIKNLLECIGFEIMTLDQLIIRSGYTLAQASPLLLELELNHYIKMELSGIIRLR